MPETVPPFCAPGLRSAAPIRAPPPAPPKFFVVGQDARKRRFVGFVERFAIVHAQHRDLLRYLDVSVKQRSAILRCHETNKESLISSVATIADLIPEEENNIEEEEEINMIENPETSIYRDEPYDEISNTISNSYSEETSNLLIKDSTLNIKTDIGLEPTIK